MGEPNASGEIGVAASAEHVYSLLSDPGKIAALAEEFSSYRWLDGAQGPRVGARFKGNNRRGFRRWSTVATITDAEPGRRFAFEARAVGQPISRWQYDIEPTEDGCRVTESTWDHRPGWLKFAGSVASGVFDRDSYNTRNIAATLRRLKEKAEGASAESQAG